MGRARWGVLSDGHGLSVCRGGSDPKTREGRECRLSGAGVEGGSHLITLRPPPPLTEVGKDRKDAGGFLGPTGRACVLAAARDTVRRMLLSRPARGTPGIVVGRAAGRGDGVAASAALLDGRWRRPARAPACCAVPPSDYHSQTA